MVLIHIGETEVFKSSSVCFLDSIAFSFMIQYELTDTKLKDIWGYKVKISRPAAAADLGQTKGDQEERQ